MRANAKWEESMYGVLRWSVVCALLPSVALAQKGGGAAQSYPNRAIRFVVPSTPAGITDILARSIGKHLTDAWGQPVIVDNRPGAGQNYGSEIVAKSQPDGYTLLFAGIANTVAPALYPNLAYDPVKDLVWITNMANVPIILVALQSSPVTNAKELVALAKAQPGKLTYGSAGFATSGHLAGALLQYMTKTSMVHVPYKGSAVAIPDLLGGRIDFYFGAMASPMPFVKSGRLRAIGLASIRRSPSAPEIPTLDEQGLKGFDASTFYAIAARAGTPKDIVAKLNTEVVRILKLPEVSKALAAGGAEFVGNSSAEVTTFVKSEITKWAKVMKETGTKIE
jgi:tripartite-type tricarboxylate transporter receptor subunit TctC